MRRLSQRVCLLVNSLGIGGAEAVVRTLFEGLRSQGVDVRLLCLEQSPQATDESLPVDHLATHSGDEHPLRKRLALRGLARLLKAYIERHDIGLVQSHIYRANYVNVMARRAGSSHAVQLVNHGMPSQYRAQGVKGWASLRLVRQHYPLADQVICPSQAMADELAELDVPGDRLRCIPNPIDLAAVRRAAEGPLPEDIEGTYFVAIGRMVALKRFADLIQAYSMLKDPTATLVLLGDGPERADLEQQVATLGLGGRVRFLSHLDNPFPLIAGARALVSASASEGFSLVIAYALALGVPVISSDCPGGPGEILQGGQYGQLYPVGDVERLAIHLADVLEDSAALRAKAERGRGRVAAFDLPVVTGQYLAAMRELAAI